MGARSPTVELDIRRRSDVIMDAFLLYKLSESVVDTAAETLLRGIGAILFGA